MPQQSRRIALVTGSTDGVGRFVAERLGGDPQAYDSRARARLWALSLELAGLTHEGI